MPHQNQRAVIWATLDREFVILINPFILGSVVTGHGETAF